MKYEQKNRHRADLEPTPPVRWLATTHSLKTSYKPISYSPFCVNFLSGRCTTLEIGGMNKKYQSHSFTAARLQFNYCRAEMPLEKSFSPILKSDSEHHQIKRTRQYEHQPNSACSTFTKGSGWDSLGKTFEMKFPFSLGQGLQYFVKIHNKSYRKRLQNGGII